MKSIEFRGTSMNDLRSFPPSTMREAGHQLDKVQHGLPPDDSKAMSSIGAGAIELRIWDEPGTVRVGVCRQAERRDLRAALLSEKDSANRQT